MPSGMKRRRFIELSLSAGTAVCGASMFGGLALFPNRGGAAPRSLISPGCRTSKVKIARIYMGKPQPHWPKPSLDLEAEVKTYEGYFETLKNDFRDVEFIVDELVTDPNRIEELQDRLDQADGILVVKLSIWTGDILAQILQRKKPVVLYSAPYTGHEWVGYGGLLKKPEGSKLECLLTSDTTQLAAGIRPFRAIHHMREAKILNVTERELAPEYLSSIKSKFGTTIEKVTRDKTLAAYEAVSDADAEAEAKRWTEGAEAIMEPSAQDIHNSCKLALALERMLDEEEATVITVDCYGTMYKKLPAYPCIGFSRLNDMGLGGICESDLQSAMTHILMQSLTGKPGFISDPTMDVSRNSAILAHCLGSTKMDGPDGEQAPYKLRSIMERQEGCVPQVRMRMGQKVTQAKIVGDGLLLYFTGDVIEVPETDRGCRTKITVQVDGDAEKLWQNWSHGLHRVTCYGDLTQDFRRFCKFKEIDLVNEA